MNDNLLDKAALEAAISQLDHTAHDCRIKIVDIRRSMDAACDQGLISLHQWRRMTEALGEIQAKCAAVNPNKGWNLLKHPARSDGSQP